MERGAWRVVVEDYNAYPTYGRTKHTRPTMWGMRKEEWYELWQSTDGGKEHCE